MKKLNRDLVAAGFVWLVLTALGEWAVVSFPFVVPATSAQGEEIDFAFRLLLIYSIPVMAFVLAALFYSIFRWRTPDPSTAGAPIRGHRGFEFGWLGVSVALAALVFVHPGLTGLLELGNAPEPDVVIDLEGVQWHWNVAYRDLGIALEDPDEIVLPQGRTIEFVITSRDVIHSFWVPAFRMKQDAIPGETRRTFITPTELGSFEEDPLLRVQCAELCGTGHARMMTPVRVVTQAEFDEWAGSMTAGANDGGMDMSAPGDGHDG